MSTPERRKHTRHPVRLQARVHSPGGQFQETVIELSISGARLQAKRSIAPGTNILISLEDYKDKVLHGTVVWVRQMLQQAESLYQMGVEIYALADALQNDIIFPSPEELMDELISQIDKK